MTITNTPPEQPDINDGFGRRMAWLGAGFVLPFYSVEYYLGAIRKPLRRAMLFFALFMTLAAALTTGRANSLIQSFREQTLQAYQEGEFPVITIQNGTASVDGEDPFILEDPTGIFFAVDTTGGLDRDTLLEKPAGFLITQTKLVTYRSGRAQSIELQNYNLAFGLNQIVIDGDLVNQLFSTVSLVYLIIAGLAIWVWDVIIWYVFLVITAYFLWGPIRQAVPVFSYRAVLTIGIYAHLPAFTVNHILNLFDVRIIFQYTILLTVFWIGALFLVLRGLAEQALKRQSAESTPTPVTMLEAPSVRLWPAWLGLPVIGLISANSFFPWEYSPFYILAGTAVTIAVLLLIDSRQNLPDEDKPGSTEP